MQTALPMEPLSILQERVAVMALNRDLQLWKTVSETGPKDMAEFEAWCQTSIDHLERFVRFDEDRETHGELDEQVFYEAADLVAEAGLFALGFGSTELYGLCQRCEGMRPG